MMDFLVRKVWDGNKLYLVRPQTFTDVARVYHMNKKQLIDYANSHPMMIIR